MAISAPTSLAVTPASGFVAPSMAAEPLATAHQNINYLWTYHSPPMVDVCPTLAAAQTRSTMVIPILPSVDGIKYAGVLCVVPSATSTFGWAIRYTTSYVYGATTWTSWASGTGVSGTANTLSAIAIAAATLPANAVAIELDVDVGGGTGTIRVDHLLLYPQADAPTAGVRTSEYIASDDGLLSTATAAIHVEWLNRCKTSPVALLKDRKQCAFSFVQIEGNGVAFVATSTEFSALPIGRLWLPYQTEATLHCRVIASASTGTTTGCVRLGSDQQSIADRATFAADRTIQSDTLTVTTKGDKGMEYVDLVLQAKQSTGTPANLRIHACMVWWEPMG